MNSKSSDANTLAQGHPLESILLLKQTSHEIPRKAVTFRETNLDECISSSFATNMNMMQIQDDSSQKNSFGSQQNQTNMTMPNSQRAQWLLDNTEYNYRSKNNRRNSTIIDTKQFVLSKRRASLAGSGGVGETIHHLSTQSERQKHFKQSTYESTNENYCKM